VTSALRRAHAEFLAGRDATLHWPDANLARYMASWRRWLNAVGPSRSGLEGAWINGSGTITIEHRPTGGYAVRANGDDPVRGSYTCEFIGIARRDGQSRLEVVWDTTGDEEDGGEGWTLKLQRKGGLIHLTEERNNSDAERASFCGARGSLEGAYLPARLKPTAVRAWRPAGEASESAD
jgi:hypothetical protein